MPPITLLRACLLALPIAAPPALALSMAPEEFAASRQMACVLALQSLGQLSEAEYGERAHTVLDDFEETEQSNIVAKALGYYDGLMFEIADDDSAAITLRLEDFVASRTCKDDFHQVTLTL